MTKVLRLLYTYLIQNPGVAILWLTRKVFGNSVGMLFDAEGRELAKENFWSAFLGVTFAVSLLAAYLLLYFYIRTT